MTRSHTLLLLSVSLMIVTGCRTPEADPNIGEALARCVYINGFSDELECKEYLGSSWTMDAIRANCDSPVPGSDPGVVEAGIGCDRSAILGICEVDPGTVDALNIIFPGEPGDSCSGLRTGCNFAGGDFVPAPACGGEDIEIDDSGSVPFTPPMQVCVEPLPGEPPGQGPDGQVCTWEAISASTEEGRDYIDYASCEPVLTQRPYWAAPVDIDTAPDDPRYTDPAWQTEYEWVTQQVESSACVCCHSTTAAPDSGPSGWYLESEGIWVDGVDDDGLAMLAGWVDSTAFGAFHPRDNNGFERTETGLPTTDTARMRAFLEGELARRGFTPADFADTPPFGGPLADQLSYVPEPCPEGVGVMPNGRIKWTGGGARYLYLLAPWADAPGVPPNLDLPLGTVWRLDVRPDADPVRSGISYATAPEGSFQAWPEVGLAPALKPGNDYYLYVLKDVYQPLTRCVFEYTE